MQLNSGWSSTYKTLARKAEFRICQIAEDPVSAVVVDVRSRLFRYFRKVIPNRPLHEKIKCVFGLLKEIGIQDEEEKTCANAWKYITGEAALLLPRQSTYVMCSRPNCRFKVPLKESRKDEVGKKITKLYEAMNRFRHHIMDISILLECHVAFESYLIANIENLCLTLHEQVQGHNLLQNVLPESSDYYESDRVCADLSLAKSQAILSEDFDCVALFGARMMIREVSDGFFTYTSLKDVMDVFSADTRRNLVHKCCIIGTDYNLGIKGIGPVKAAKIDERNAREKFEACIAAQGIEVSSLLEFFRIQ